MSNVGACWQAIQDSVRHLTRKDRLQAGSYNIERNKVAGSPLQWTFRRKITLTS